MSKPQTFGVHQGWPALDYASWEDTCTALHLYLQIVGKYRLARTPWLNHSWHATFYLDASGLTSSIVPDGSGIEFAFDLREHRLVGRAGDGRSGELALGPSTVAQFQARFTELVRELGGNPSFHGSPNEVPDPVPFIADHRERPYDGDAVTRYYQALASIDRVFKAFRTSFLGKSSPVHLFWGSFDLAVTRFSGRRAPRHPGGVPALPDAVAQEAYDQEVASAGFWPGAGLGYPAFYAYAYPAPPGYAEAGVSPPEAFFHPELREFILPYEALQAAPDPQAVLLSFLESTYLAAANLGQWDRDALECSPGQPLRPRMARPLPDSP